MTAAHFESQFFKLSSCRVKRGRLSRLTALGAGGRGIIGVRAFDRKPQIDLFEREIVARAVGVQLADSSGFVGARGC